MITLEGLELPASMPAGVLAGPGQLSVQEIPVWDIDSFDDPELVLIRTAACGICGSDFRYFAGENPWAQHSLGRFIPNPPNIVLGHEYAGTVVAVKREKDRGLLGKRVAPISSSVCRKCEDCVNGRTRLCENTVHMGHGQGWGKQPFYPGAYAPFTLGWASTCFEVPRDVPIGEAAMLDVLGVAVHCVDQGNIVPGRPVLVLGAGPVGNAIGQVAYARGASEVVLVERSAVAESVARALGIFALRTGDELSPGHFYSVFDTIGSDQSFHKGLSCLAKTGTFICVAVHEEVFPFEFMRLSGERKVTTSCNFEVGDFPEALSLLAAGRLKVENWFKRIRLEDVPGYFQDLSDRPDKKGFFKLLIEFDEPLQGS